MKGKTTIQLFEEVINTRAIHNQLGIKQNTVMNLRRNHKAGLVKEDKMNEILHLAGYIIVQERLWAEKP